ncbi:UNVERIFIED_CONTAM: hypothetical protein DES50_101977 [Williamsia faeni]
MSEQAKEPTRIQKIIGAIVIKAYQLKQKIKPAKAAPPAAPQPETETTNP